MAKSATKVSPQEHLALQREYVKSQALEFQSEAAQVAGNSGLVDERMLAESMRSVRYHNEMYAAGDIIDNAIESGASQVHVAYRTEGNSIMEMAFIDDGSGIVREFLPHAVKWGGSSNAGRRNLFGRFGFGLPSASVNRGRAFDVYSRVDTGDKFSVVTVDLDEISTGKGSVALPKVKQADLPAWVVEYIASTQGTEGAKFDGGIDKVKTVVVWRSLDKLKNPKIQAQVANMLEHLGITYAGWLPVVTLIVQGKPVEPVDVLFTSPGFRWYEIDGAPNAEPQRPITVMVKDRDGQKHEVTVRFSLLSVDAVDAEVPSEGRGPNKKIRWKIRKQYNGIFVTRNGRFIELAKPMRSEEKNDNLITFDVYARQVGIAIDFPPALDEVFGVTPDKQSIEISESLLDLLDTEGVITAFKALKKVVADERTRRKAERDQLLTGDDERPSEKAIAKVIKCTLGPPQGRSPESIAEGKRNFQRKVKEISAQTGLPEEVIAETQEKKAVQRPYRVEFQRGLDQDPFYTPTMDKTQMVLIINTGHPWYTELYARLGEDQAQLRSGLELFLWVLGVKEIDATGEKRTFYRNERRSWSQMLADAFDVHPEIFSKFGPKGVEGDEEQLAWQEDDSTLSS